MNAFDLEERVDAYESALLAGRASVGALSAYLPSENETARRATLVELLRVTLEHRFLAGETHVLEAWRSEFPEIFEDAAALAQLAFEEYRLHAERGSPLSREAYAERFAIDTSAWPNLQAPALSISADEAACWNEFSLSEPVTAARLAISRRKLPEVGERFGPFALVALLGQGAFGKVFLARQDSLAQRLVAVKISGEAPVEADKLARMQHGNIVPVYSVHRRGRLAAVCMPYLGGVTLADLVRSMRNRAPNSRSVEELRSTVLARKAELSTVVNGSSPPDRQEEPIQPTPDGAQFRWAKYSLAEAMVWIIARVAAGLRHAHERGILHRDIKPANILISDEGEPLILDFNLSSETVRTEAHLARLGGTLPYMSPEQLEQFHSGGSIDVRSDIFSLGVVLYEALSGQHPFASPRGALEPVIARMIRDRHDLQPPRLNKVNPAVSPGLAAIASKCLQADPAARYQTAAELQEDLERHLDSRPLKFARDASLRERAEKWMRRHPRLTSSAAVGLAATLLLAVGAGLWSGQARQLSEKLAIEKFQSFASESPEVRALLSQRIVNPMFHEPALKPALALLATYRVLDDPRWTQDKMVQRLPAPFRDQLATEVTELLLLLGRIQAEGEEAVAERLPSPAAIRQRALNDWNQLTARQLPESLEVGGSSGNSSEPLLVSQQVIAALEAGRLGQAIARVQQLTQLRPRDPYAWLLLGHCHAERGDALSADAAYSAALSLKTDFYLAREARGLSRLENKHFAEAVADFDAAVGLHSTATLIFYRGLARMELRQYPGAIDDISAALEQGLTQTRAYFFRARCHEAVGDQASAKADRERGLQQIPQDVLSWIERGLNALPVDARQAEADLVEAVRLGKHTRYARVARMNLAHVQAERLEKTSDAVVQLDAILDDMPDDPLARGSRAVLLARLGREAGALEDVEAMELRPCNPFALYQQACALALLSKEDARFRDKALAKLREALARDPALRATAPNDPDLKALGPGPHLLREATPGSSELPMLPDLDDVHAAAVRKD